MTESESRKGDKLEGNRLRTCRPTLLPEVSIKSTPISAPPATSPKHKDSKPAEDLPGLGQWYCVECAKILRESTRVRTAQARQKPQTEITAVARGGNPTTVRRKLKRPSASRLMTANPKSGDVMDVEQHTNNCEPQARMTGHPRLGRPFG